MKIVATSAMAGLVLFLTSAFSGVFSAGAQDVLPEENLLVLACNYLGVEAQKEDVTVYNCRQNGPPEIDGTRAVVHIRVKAATGVFKFAIYFQRTLWSGQGWIGES